MISYGTFGSVVTEPAKAKSLVAAVVSSLGIMTILLLFLYTPSPTITPTTSASWQQQLPSQVAAARLSGEEDGTDPSKWRLVWADEFDGSALDQSKWHLETINGQQSGNNELEIYTTHPKNFPVANGHLKITAHKERVGDWRFTSARLTTQYSFSFTYGRIVARFKNPKGKGLWPAIWMLGSSIPNKPWPACGEVDIMEMVGGSSWEGGGDDRAVGTAHWLGQIPSLPSKTQKRHHKKHVTIPGAVYDGGSITTAEVASGGKQGEESSRISGGVVVRTTQMNKNSNNNNNKKKNKRGPPLNSDFYIMALEWNQTHFVWSLNDVIFKVKSIVDDPKDPGLKAFHEPFFLLLNLAIGGNWPGSPDRDTLSRFPHEFALDYIRVYQTA